MQILAMVDKWLLGTFAIMELEFKIGKGLTRVSSQKFVDFWTHMP